MRWKSLQFTTLAFGLFAAAASALDKEPEPVVAPMIFASGFESGTLVDQQGWTREGNMPSLTVAGEPVREGKYAMKAYLNRLTSNTSFRTELRPIVEHPKIDQEYWYGFSTYVPSPFVADTQWELIAQWHDTPDSGEDWRNPILALYMSGDEYQWTSRWDDKAITPKDANGNFIYGGTNRWKVGSISATAGEWQDWVVRVKWRWVNDQGGILQIWKNGELVVDHIGPNTFNDQKGRYFKFGIYKGWRDRYEPKGIVSDRLYFFDSFRMAGPGGTYAMVAPGGTAAKPQAPSALIVQ